MKWNEKIKHKLAHLDKEHRLPVSRRDFVGHGLAAGGAAMVGPSLLSLLSRAAHSETAKISCPTESNSTDRVPVLIFDLVGGPIIAGSNIIVGSQGQSSPITGPNAYKSYGLTATPTQSQIADRYGLKFFSESGILQGIDSVLSGEGDTQKKIDGVVFSSISLDDTNINPLNPMYLLARAGAGGTLSKLLGSADTNSGAYSQPAVNSYDSSIRPTLIRGRQSALNLAEPGRLAELLSKNTDNLENVARVMRAASRMSSAALKKFQARNLNDQVKNLIECGYLKAENLMSKNQKQLIDPDLNAGTATVDDVFANPASLTAPGNPLRVDVNTAEVELTRTIVHLLLDGFAGAGTVQLGGYDYHGLSRSFTDARDRHVGRLIGQAIGAAKIRGKSIAIYVYSDGAVASIGANPNGMKTDFVADSGGFSASFMMVYHHGAPDEQRPGGVLKTDRQVGGYMQSGANRNAQYGSAVTRSVNVMSQAMALNYLALLGKLEEDVLINVLGDHPFRKENFGEYVAFRKIVG